MSYLGGMTLQCKFTPCLVAIFALATLVPAVAAPPRLAHDLTFPLVTRAGSALQRVHADEASKSDIGSANTVTADPPVEHPNETPCVAPLFTNQAFAVYAGIPFTYSPPRGCPGPFAKIVFNGNFSVTAGNQFDRTASIQIGNVPLYFGTTAEPDATLSPSWHVERDVTDDAALLATTHTGEADIFNIVNSTYTGIIHGTAFLQFYPARGNVAAAQTPDLVLPFPGVAGGPQALDTGTSTLSATYTLPANVERAYFDVYSQSQQTDEQYFLCAPTNLAPELFACPNTAFRETEVSIDGTPAGVAPIYPWIYTGGLDPFLWAPIPGVQTLEFKPYRVDLTPFAALLANGKPHRLAISVDNADNYFQSIATLFAYLDHGSHHVTGALTRDTLVTGPQPSVSENLTGTSPSVDGTITVRDSRSYQIDGYVNTSKGRISTSVSSTLQFANAQQYSNESATTGTLVANQSTNATTTVVTTGGGGFEFQRRVIAFPISVSLDTVLDSSGTGTQIGSIDQHFVELYGEIGSRGIFASSSMANSSPATPMSPVRRSTMRSIRTARATRRRSRRPRIW